MPERLTDERLVAPHDGGCWYCHKADENLVFSIEWDAYVHLTCVREALEQDPQDAEAWVFARELGIAAEIITELRVLRRVAKAAERAHRRAERLDYAPDDQWAMRSQEWREAHRALGEALADWRRVGGGGGA